MIHELFQYFRFKILNCGRLTSHGLVCAFSRNANKIKQIIEWIRLLKAGSEIWLTDILACASRFKLNQTFENGFFPLNELNMYQNCERVFLFLDV